MSRSSGCVLHLPMTEKQGTSVADISRYGNDGTIANSAPWKSQGISFDGVNQSIGCGDDSSLKLTNTITIEAMVQTNKSLEQAIVDKCDDGDTPTQGYALRMNAAGMAIFVTNTDEYSSGVQIDDGRMHHIVGVLDGTNKTIYVDGVVAATKAYAVAITDSGHDLHIGDNYKGELYFNGFVDAVKILNRGVSTLDAVNNYNTKKYEYITPVAGDVIDTFIFNVNNTQTISGLFSTVSGETISIDWGDGSARSEYTGTDQAWSKDYGSAGDRVVRMYNSGTLTKFRMDAAGADISFDLANLPASLLYLHCGGNNTVSGDLSGLPASLVSFKCFTNNTISGTLADLPATITTFACSGSNTISGTIADLPTSLTSFNCDGNNTISGDIADIPANITYYKCVGNNTISDYTGKTWTTTPATFNLQPTGVGGLSEAEVDQLLIDFDTDLTWAAGNVITITGTNAPRSAASGAAVTSIEGEGATVNTTP